MKTTVLRQHLEAYLAGIAKDRQAFQKEVDEQRRRIAYYQGWTAERLARMTAEEAYEYLAQLWSMAMWGNKEYVVNKILQQNGLEAFRRQLAELLWGQAALARRWNGFRQEISSVGPAMMSELLCYLRPQECMVWNRRIRIAFENLGMDQVPVYDYQMNGEVYERLCGLGREMAEMARQAGAKEVDLLWVNEFIWSCDSLQQSEPTAASAKPVLTAADFDKLDKQTSTFIHNDIRDKIAEIGTWLGFQSQTEKRVAAGSKVDTVWEATIGNMGRVIYVFEVQTKGSIDSLLMNLLKSLNNPAVQGVVAISDKEQLKKIAAHAAGVPGLRDKLKLWDYEEVLKVHESLAAVNESINKLGLVPQGF